MEQKRNEIFAIYHTATDVKRSLLDYYLDTRELDLEKFLEDHDENFHHFEDIRQARRKSAHITSNDLGLGTLNHVLWYCDDMFWTMSFEDFLNKHKDILSTKANNRVLPSGNIGSDVVDLDCLFSEQTGLAAKGITLWNLNKKLSFTVLSVLQDVCPLLHSVNLLTEKQSRICFICVNNEQHNAVEIEELWDTMKCQILAVATFCKQRPKFESQINAIQFDSLPSLDHRMIILDDGLNDQVYGKNKEFSAKARRQLDKIHIEKSMDAVKHLCGGKKILLELHGGYESGQYPTAVVKNADTEYAYAMMRIDGQDLPSVGDDERFRTMLNSEAITVKSVEKGSILIYMELSPSAFQSVEYFLGVIDEFVSKIFPNFQPKQHRKTSQIAVTMEFYDASNVRPSVVAHPMYNVDIGKSVTLQCSVTGDPAYTKVYWKKEENGKSALIMVAKNGKKYSGSTVTSPSLIINNVDKNDTASYVCYAENCFGTGKSIPVALTVCRGKPILAEHRDYKSGQYARDVVKAAEDGTPYMEPYYSSNQLKQIYGSVVEHLPRRARSKSFPDLYTPHGKSRKREWFFKLKLFCDDKYDVHIINSHGIEECYPFLEKYVGKKEHVEMMANPIANEGYNAAFEAIYKEKMGLIKRKDDYVRKNFDLACRFMLSNGVSTNLIKDILIKSMEKQISCIAKAVSWCLLKNLVHVQRFLPLESLTKVEDIWPGFYCHCSKEFAKGHSKICSREAVIVIEINEYIENLKHNFMGIQIIQSCSDQNKDTKRASEKTTCEPIENTNQQAFSKLSGESVELYFQKHSKLTIIYISPDISDCVQLYCQIKGVIPMGEDHFPKQICGFGTNVTEGRVNFMAQIRIGDSIGTAKSAGTLGGFIRWQGFDTFLTCAHVVYDRPLLLAGSKHRRHHDKVEIFCHDTSGGGKEMCGYIVNHVFEHRDPSQPSVDAALVKIKKKTVVSKDDIIRDGTPVPKKHDFLGMKNQYVNDNCLCVRNIPPSGILKTRSVGMVSGYFEDYIKYEDYDADKRSFEDREPGILAEFREALQEEIHAVMSSYPKPALTAVPVHFQQVILPEIAKRSERINVRFYHQLSVEGLPFQGGDSGTCVYIVKDQSAASSTQPTGCLGMAIASYLDKRDNKLKCIVTPTEAILKRLGLL